MRITRVRARDFLSFEDLDLELDRDGVNVIVGPNGSGKSNLRRVFEIALPAIDLAAGVSPETLNALDEFADANRHGSTTGFEVALDIEVTHAAERELILRFVRAAFLTQSAERRRGPHPSLANTRVQDLPVEALEPLFTGTLVIERQPTVTPVWNIHYRFREYVISLRDDNPNYIRAVSRTPPPSVEVVNQIHDPLGAIAQMSPTWTKDALLPAHGTQYLLATSTAQVDARLSTLREFEEAFGVGTGDRRIYGLALPLSIILRRAFVAVEDARVPPRRRVAAGELLPGHAPETPGSAGIELFRLKNGGAAQRERFRYIAEGFRHLTGSDVDVRIAPAPARHPRNAATEPDDAGGTEFLVDPIVVRDGFEVPIHRAGTGTGELLRVLIASTSPDESVVFLDEPAANLHPRLQQALLVAVQRAGNQAIVVTHSPYMIPLGRPEDLRRVVRLSIEEGKTSLRKLTDVADEDGLRKLHRMLTPADVRALLFSSGVVLVEGETDQGVLEVWLSKSMLALDRGSPEAQNVAIFNVGGDQGFGPHVRLLDNLGIPWIIVADLPVLARVERTSLARQLGLDDAPGPPEGDLDEWRRRWADHGVFTLSDGVTPEIEGFLERLDPEVWEEASSAFPSKSVRKGRFFGEATECPPEVEGFYAALLRRMGREIPADGEG